MPRARNIKPSFFVNEELGEIDPLGRLLFIGLWTIADYKGDLEWKPKRIKLQTIPYDDADIESLAINLDKSGLIRFYSDGRNIYLRIVNFLKHQNPHKNERDKGSDIPEYTEDMRQVVDLQGITINRDKSGEERNDSTSNHADSLFLNPDSRNLNPDVLNPDIPKDDSIDYMSGKPDHSEFIDYLNMKTGKAFKPVETNLRMIRARLKEGHSGKDIYRVIDRKCEQWLNDEKMSEYLRPSTLFNAEKFNQYVGEIGKETTKQLSDRLLNEWVGDGAIEGEIIG